MRVVHNTVLMLVLLLFIIVTHVIRLLHCRGLQAMHLSKSVRIAMHEVTKQFCQKIDI